MQLLGMKESMPLLVLDGPFIVGLGHDRNPPGTVEQGVSLAWDLGLIREDSGENCVEWEPL